MKLAVKPLVLPSPCFVSSSLGFLDPDQTGDEAGVLKDGHQGVSVRPLVLHGNDAPDFLGFRLNSLSFQVCFHAGERGMSALAGGRKETPKI